MKKRLQDVTTSMFKFPRVVVWKEKKRTFTFPNEMQVKGEVPGM